MSKSSYYNVTYGFVFHVCECSFQNWKRQNNNFASWIQSKTRKVYFWKPPNYMRNYQNTREWRLKDRTIKLKAKDLNRHTLHSSIDHLSSILVNLWLFRCKIVKIHFDRLLIPLGIEVAFYGRSIRATLHLPRNWVREHRGKPRVGHTKRYNLKIKEA